MFISGCLISCSDRPKNILSEKEMVSLMADMELVEAFSQQDASANRRENRIELGERVLLNHGISEETLDTTLAWYGRNLDEYTALFEKIDEEIERRKKKFIDNTLELNINQSNLWPYSPHLVMSPMNPNDFLRFSIDNPEISLGDVVTFSLAISSPASGKGLIGLEYADGSGESILNTFSNKNRFSMEVQSDTAKTISRLYGVLSFKDRKSFPLYLDSLSIVTAPLDSLDYRRKKRAQKQYSVMVNKKIEEIKPDTIQVSDSIQPIDTIPAIAPVEEATVLRKR